MTLNMNRRAYLTGQVAVAAAATVAAPSATFAASDAASDTVTSTARVNWQTATASDLERFIGDRFRVSAQDMPNTVLRLVAVESVPLGPDAPAHLPRQETVIAVFDSPDKAPIVDAGHLTRFVSHSRLGTAPLFLGPVRRRNGDDVVEMILG